MFLEVSVTFREHRQATFFTLRPADFLAVRQVGGLWFYKEIFSATEIFFKLIMSEVIHYSYLSSSFT